MVCFLLHCKMKIDHQSILCNDLMLTTVKAGWWKLELCVCGVVVVSRLILKRSHSSVKMRQHGMYLVRNTNFTQAEINLADLKYLEFHSCCNKNGWDFLNSKIYGFNWKWNYNGGKCGLCGTPKWITAWMTSPLLLPLTDTDTEKYCAVKCPQLQVQKDIVFTVFENR